MKGQEMNENRGSHKKESIKTVIPSKVLLLDSSLK